MPRGAGITTEVRDNMRPFAPGEHHPEYEFSLEKRGAISLLTRAIEWCGNRCLQIPYVPDREPYREAATIIWEARAKVVQGCKQ